MNRAQGRDWVRRTLGIIPPVDAQVPGAKPGDAPPWQPDPSNPLINQAFDNAASYIAGELGVVDAGDAVSVSVAAQTDAGPYWQDLRELEGVRSGSVIGVRRAWWNDGSQRTLLTPIGFDELDRDGRNWRDEDPGTPLYRDVQNYRLAVFPAPASAGTLEVEVTSSLMAPLHDGEGFEQLPLAFETDMLYCVAFEVAMVLPDDTEMASRAKMLEGARQNAVARITRWMRSQANEGHQPSIIPAVTRRRY